MNKYEQCAGCAHYNRTCNVKRVEKKCPSRVFICSVCKDENKCGLCPYWGCNYFKQSKLKWRLYKIKLFLRKRV